MSVKSQILKDFALFSLPTGGIGNWLTENTDPIIFERLSTLKENPLSKVQLNQLLLLGLEAGVSQGFFEYYWLQTPIEHPYEVQTIPGFQQKWISATDMQIHSLEHLKWGLYRLYVDGLLFFGDVRIAFRTLRMKANIDLKNFFRVRRFDTVSIKKRGPALPLIKINKDDRYLISEMACKSYGATPILASDLKEALSSAWKAHQESQGGRILVRNLIEGASVSKIYADRHQQLLFSADGILDEEVVSEDDLEKKYGKIASIFSHTREAALKNTKYYLSMVNDLDVYVATSMRTRQDFRNMATICDTIFSSIKLKNLELRYFDPTLSAAEGHEDKGLIECLMVKCAKALVYCAGERESYGKDAEAAMALSLGKPVIFLCDHEQRSRFYREVHPLSRLIEFDSGMAVGALVTDRIEDVSELLSRIFENKMEYTLEHPNNDGFLRLHEKVTNSVVRLQTNDSLLAQTFWNYYHNRAEGSEA